MQLKYTQLDADIIRKYNDLFPVQNCFLEVTPGKAIVPRQYVKIGDTIRNMTVYEDDVWLLSYPRTGSTWAQELIWLLGHNLDFDGAKTVQQVRAPLIELTAFYAEDHPEFVEKYIGNSVQYVANMARPRYIKSHLPLSLLPTQMETVKPKTIYIARNPKDLCVSFYHYSKLIHGLKGSLEDYCELYLTDQSMILPYWQHVLPFWKRRHDPNVLFLKYEDLKADLPTVASQCAEFMQMGHKLTDDQLASLCEYLKFDKMQSNPAVNLESVLSTIDGNKLTGGKGNDKFIRKGQVGDWKNYMSPELSERFDHWIEANTCGTGLQFDYE